MPREVTTTSWMVVLEFSGNWSQSVCLARVAVVTVTGRGEAEARQGPVLYL